jgi:hypothetical protein
MLDLDEKSRKGRRVRKETDMTSTDNTDKASLGILTLASPYYILRVVRRPDTAIDRIVIL